MKISVIIPTYNREKILAHCLTKLLEQTKPADEIVVVDDASTDNTNDLPVLKKIKYLKLHKHMGHWHARNVGIKAAKGELIIFVDSDVMVDSKFVEDHTSLHAKDKKIAVQGLVRHIRRPEHFGQKTIRIDGISATGLVIQNCSLRKQWLIDINCFDTPVTMGHMDIDLGMRLKKHGIKIRPTIRKCIAYHVDTYPTKEKLLYLFKKMEERGKASVYLIRKHGRCIGETLSNKKLTFLTAILRTKNWAEKDKAVNLLLKSIDSPFFFVFLIIKELMKYHYRAKGIRGTIRCRKLSLTL